MVLLLWMLPTRSSRKDIGDAGLERNNVMAFEKDIVLSVELSHLKYKYYSIIVNMEGFLDKIEDFLNLELKKLYTLSVKKVVLRV